MLIELQKAEKNSQNTFLAELDGSYKRIINSQYPYAIEDTMYSIIVNDMIKFNPLKSTITFESDCVEVISIGKLITDQILVKERINKNVKKPTLDQNGQKNNYDFTVWSKFSREIAQLSIRQNKLAIQLRDIIREINPKGYLKYNQSTGWFIEEPGEYWAIKIQKEKFIIKLKGSILDYRQRRINLNIEKAGKNFSKFIYSELFQLKEIKKAFEEAKYH